MMKLIICALFGHTFNDYTVSKEEHNGKWYITRTEHKCDRCELSEVDYSGSLGLAELKYGMKCSGSKLKEVASPYIKESSQ